MIGVLLKIKLEKPLVVKEMQINNRKRFTFLYLYIAFIIGYLYKSFQIYITNAKKNQYFYIRSSSTTSWRKRNSGY